MLTVLITGCAMHSNDLITELRDNYLDEEVRVVGINCDGDALLRNGVDAGYVVPRSSDPSYIGALIDICNKESVDVILPFITMELPIMAAHRERIEAKTHAKVSVSSLESILRAGSKIWLGERYPELMPKQTLVSSESDIYAFCKEVGYPHRQVCCKLPNRCGGLGFAIIDEVKGRDLTIFNKFGVNHYITLDMLVELYRYCDDNLILQEYEEGTDFSVCCLGANGELVYSLGFEAPLMSFGSAMFATIANDDTATEIARTVCKDTGLDGNFCLDFIKRPDGSMVLLEVNPRISATLPFIAKAGLNLPYLRCMQLRGMDYRNVNIDIRYGLNMSKNYESEYF